MQCRPYVHELEWTFIVNIRISKKKFPRRGKIWKDTILSFLKETLVKRRLWKGRTTQHSTAENVAWESLVTDRQEIWRSNGTKFTTGTTDSTVWKPIARTGAIVTTEKNRNTTWRATETAAGQSTTRNTPWSMQGITTADI